MPSTFLGSWETSFLLSWHFYSKGENEPQTQEYLNKITSGGDRSMKVIQWAGQGGLPWGGDICTDSWMMRRSWPWQGVGKKACPVFCLLPPLSKVKTVLVSDTGRDSVPPSPTLHSPVSATCCPKYSTLKLGSPTVAHIHPFPRTFKNNVWFN